MMSDLYHFKGMKVYVSEEHCITKQARRHRQKRLNKKYLKKYGYIKIPRKDIFQTPWGLVMHPVVFELVKESMGGAR